MQKISEWLRRAIGELKKAEISSPELDAQLLLARALETSREHLLSMVSASLSEARLRIADTLLHRRLTREPVAYIFGEKEFYGLPLNVNSSVLVPRPETELVVEIALEELQSMTIHHPLILDVGTGSGAIAVAVASHLKDTCTLIATDASLSAIMVAKSNVMRYKLASFVLLVCCDVLTGLELKADMILSNPPYVAVGEWDSLMPEIRLYEPRSALVAGEDGLDVIRSLVDQAHERLRPQGILLVEIAPSQEQAVAALVTRIPQYESVAFSKDLSGDTRVAKIIRKG